MSSDADYASFLDKANQDSSGAGAQTSSSNTKKSYGTKSVDTRVPAALEDVQEYYTSEADEPFEPVALKFAGGGGGVDADALNQLLGGDKDVQEVPREEFARQYGRVVDAVGRVGKGNVRVFRVELGGARAEVWVVVVVVDGEGERVVGLKALSVES